MVTKFNNYMFYVKENGIPLSENDKYMCLSNAENLFGDEYIKEFNENDGVLIINEFRQTSWELSNQELNQRLTSHVDKSINNL